MRIRSLAGMLVIAAAVLAALAPVAAADQPVTTITPTGR